MNGLQRGLVLTVCHVLLVSSLGGKLLYDRATRPRVWMLCAPYDPSLPIRGRYVRLRLLRPADPSAPAVSTAEPVAFFIPEHIQDPSRRPAGEELWVEVTLPRKSPPRPIRLAVVKNGVFSPLDIR
jgi:hypothetical protein